jgi:hypothetical protein
LTRLREGSEARTDDGRGLGVVQGLEISNVDVSCRGELALLFHDGKRLLTACGHQRQTTDVLAIGEQLEGVGGLTLVELSRGSSSSELQDERAGEVHHVQRVQRLLASM